MNRRTFLNSTVVTTLLAEEVRGQQKQPPADSPVVMPVMPLFAGYPVPSFTIHYGRCETLDLTFASARDVVASVLPDDLKPVEPVTVTLRVAYYDQVDAFAGRGYNEAMVLVPARFDGERDHVVGAYAPVMFLDDTFAIILGREFLGVPKLPADVSRIRDLGNGRLGCEVSLWGHFLFGLEAADWQPSPSSGTGPAKRQQNLLGYKYIPSLGGPPDAAYPTSIPVDYATEAQWTAKTGRVRFGDASGEGVLPLVDQVVTAVKKLTGGPLLRASRDMGSMALRSELARRLR